MVAGGLGVKLDIETIGEEKVLNSIAEIRARAKDARPATRKVKEILIAANRKQFESQGSYSGDSWAPLAASTLERKSREGIDPRPLHGKTGALGASLTGGRGKRSAATKQGARAGSKVWYGVFARSGTKSGEPARKLVGLSHADQVKIGQVVVSYVAHGR
jgi:phage gpG-like protein